MKSKNKIKFGFTLIELLVVISIIGILTTLLIANFSSIRDRARDAQRKSDLKQIQKALELYKESQSSPQYPNTNFDGLITSLQNGNYMKKVPVDPVNNASSGFVYSYTRDAGDALNYTLRACLENASDKDGVTDATACPTAPNKKFELNAP